jgi:6-pyruvoyltetrahydropterin/6-carboxytetrahydropterin synthase
MMEIVKEFQFEAAHFLPHEPQHHPNRRVHGHSFAVEVAVRGEPDPISGQVLDFAVMKQAMDEVRAQLDHRLLNDVDGLAAPTLEGLCRFIWQNLVKRLPGLVCVTVRRDSCRERCSYGGD